MTETGADNEAEAERLVHQVLTPPFARDPYAVCSALRAMSPMHRSDLGFWCASDYQSCLDVFRSPALGQGFNANRLGQDPRFAASSSLQLFGRMLPFIDPPEHSRIRRLLAPYFTPRAIEAMRPYTRALVERLLDGLASAGGGDLVADFAEEIPVAVVCQLLGGMGEADQGNCREWAEGLVEAVHPHCDEAMMRRADESAEGFRAYFMDLLLAGGDHGGDLVTRLLDAHRDGDLDTDELLATATTLVGAAYHNTRNHIATAIHLLLVNPSQLAALRDDGTKVAAAVEEVLRFEPPVQVTLPRVALRDVVVGDVTVAAGEHVCGFLPGANRDPARYRDPDVFDISRPDGGSLALAFGIHSCIGAAMARMEAEEAVGGFFRRFGSVRLLDESPALDLPGLPLTRGFTSIGVEIL